MTQKIRNLIKIIPLVCLLAVNSYGQTWQIGYPSAASVTATYSNGTLTISGTGTMQDWSSVYDVPWNIGTNGSTDFDHITSVMIHSGVTSIGNNAFSTAHNISYLSIPNTVKRIGEAAFYNCLSLIQLDIPYGVTAIERNAFSACYGLTSINIPASVSSIGQYAFSSANNMSSMHLTDVTVNWTNPLSVPSNTFLDVNVGNVQLHTPSGTESLYSTTPVWQNFKIVGSQPYLTVSPTSYSFSANSSISPLIIINSNQSWTVSDNASWLTTSKTGGSNNSTFTMTATANTSTSSRSATVTVTGGGITRTVSVTQDGDIPAGAGGTVNGSNGMKLNFLTYNLGANPDMTVAEQIAYTPADDFDATVYGDLYQWGRRTDGHEKRNSSTTTTLSSTDVPGHNNFIYRFNDDWVRDWRSPKNDNLWSNPKTANDPCPSGYRLPTMQEWTDVKNNNTWTWTGNGYKISPDDGNTYTMFLPAGGSRGDYINSASVNYSGGMGDYWSSTVDNEGGAQNLHFHSTTVYAPISGVSIHRIHGYCVRCVKEEGAVPPPTLTVSPEICHFPANGGNTSITVSSNQSWSVTKSDLWLTCLPANGSNDGSFTITATANSSAFSRSATVTVSVGGISKTVIVTQEELPVCGVEPLLKTQWNQGAPYYNDCPMYNGQRSVTGCVATAMVQIMNYWQHPALRTQSIPAYTTDRLRISIPAITGTTTYDWNNMKNTTAEYTTVTQRSAVARLMYECGVAVKMNYAPDGSGAFVETNLGPAAVLPVYFNYDVPEVIYRDPYNGNWDRKLREELDAGRPVFYAGFGSGGHAFVCDGYKCEDNTFHFNWGWDGSGDGYFATSALNVSGYAFNQSQRVITGIKPNQGNYMYATEYDANTFSITANAGTDGYIIPQGTAINYPGASQPYVFAANSGYEIDQVFINGTPDVAAKANGYYIFSNITANHSIIVTFRASSSGIEDIQSQNISVYPNPTKDEIFIQSELPINKIEIYSLTGSLMISANSVNGKISVFALPRGIYLLKVYTDKGLITKKIIKD